MKLPNNLTNTTSLLKYMHCTNKSLTFCTQMIKASIATNGRHSSVTISMHVTQIHQFTRHNKTRYYFND